MDTFHPAPQVRPTALVLEHEMGEALLLKRSLSKWFDVRTFPSYHIALDFLKRVRSPDLIISDLYLIYGNEQGIEAGLEFLKELKSNDETRNIPVFIFSKYGDFLQHPDNYPKHFQWGGGKLYSREEGLAIQHQLQDLGIDSSDIFNKFDYDSPESFARQVHSLWKKKKAKEADGENS